MRFCILGPLEVFGSDGDAVEVRGAKLRTVLAVLLLRAGDAVTIDQLSDALWGDDPPAGSGNALQTHISKLRRLLEPGMLDTRVGSYSLVAAATSIDSTEFLELAATGRSQLRQGDPAGAAATLRRALAVWRGPALAEFDHLDFATADRVRLAEAQLAAREDLLEAQLADGRHDQVIADAEATLVEHPLRERVWAQLMLALYRADRQADSLRAFQRARDVLGDELGLDPGPALRDLERRVLDHDPDLLLAAPVPPPARAGPREVLSNIPTPLSSFVGRVDELAAVRDLADERRLVTVIGPAGVGKTRLVTEVARGSADRWPGGSWFVDLGFESGDGAAHRALVRTFGRRLGRAESDTVEWLAAGLGSTRVLVVLDNCEHVLAEVVPLVEEVLQRCPSLHVLATSREPLGCIGELVRRLDPLPLDDAIALFTSRATDSSVELDGDDDDTVSAVHSICTQLDRLPLAIELTAARTRVFSATRLAILLQQRSALVSTDSSARPQRQQTLDAAVDWSYDLLFDAEQRLLCRLSVFVDGFTLDAAMAVCADDDLPAGEVGLLLARLVDKSLVTPARRPGGGDRFVLLRPVAEFAARRLEPTGETTALRHRHTAWLVELTTPLMAALRGPSALQWAEVINAELENLTSAASWSLREGDPTDGLQIAVNLGWYAFLSANVHDDHSMIVAALDRAVDAAPSLRCRGLLWAGILSVGHTDGRAWAMDAIDVARRAGGLGSGERHQPQALGIERTMAAIELARNLDDHDALMEALGFGALHLAAIGHAPELVVSLATELDALAATCDDGWFRALSLGVRGLACYVARDLHGAAARYAESAAAFEAVGDAGTAALFGICASETAEFVGDLALAISSVEPAFALGSAVGFRSSTILGSVLCWLASRNGETDRALQLGADALSAVRRPFNPVIRAQALFALGAAEERAGALDSAEEHLTEALAIHRQVAMRRETAMDLRHLGFVHLARGDRAVARDHFRGSARLATAVGLPWTIMLTTRSLALAVVDDDVELASRLIGAADSVAERFGYAATVDDQAGVDDVLERSVALAGATAVAGWRRDAGAQGLDSLAELLGR